MHKQIKSIIPSNHYNFAKQNFNDCTDEMSLVVGQSLNHRCSTLQTFRDQSVKTNDTSDQSGKTDYNEFFT